MATRKDFEATYTTYRNYSVALARLLQQEYPSQRTVVDQLTAKATFGNIGRCTSALPDEFDRALHMAWHTEMLITKQLAHRDLLPFALPWNMVQRYYAVHQMARAYFTATDPTVKRWHADTLNALNRDLVNCGDLFPPPWRALIKGYGPLGTLQTFNINPALPAPLPNALYDPDQADPWRYFALMLKTTQNKKVREQADKWKHKYYARRVLKSKLQSLIDQHANSTSVFDFFYRMRLRSNYRDIDLFLIPYIDEDALAKWQQAIILSLSYTLILFECLITKAVGKERYQRALSSSPCHTATLGRHTINMAQVRWDSCLQSYF